MTDFPDRDEWTDRPLRPDPPIGSCDCCGKDGAISKVTAYGIETYVCHRCQGMSDEDAGLEAMEAAEWDELGATDLIGPDERTKPTDLSSNDFTDV